MSWGTDFTAEIFLSRMTFRNESELKNKISEVEEDIASACNELMMYAASNPRDIVPKEWEEDAITFIKNKIKDLMEGYRYNVAELTNLNHFLDSNPKYDKQ